MGKGCEKCGNTGSKGRLAIHEVLHVNEEVRELISTRASEHALRKAARRVGMRTLLEDGIEKAAQGLATIDEVLRVVSHGGRSDDAEEPVTANARQTSASRPSVSVPATAPEHASDETGEAPKRVLIVEDSPTIVSVVKYFLELEGFEVLVAEDGRIGFEMARTQQPDLIVSDVHMPGMGGVEMVKALRAEADISNVRILMLTSEDTVETETESLEAGADDYLVKPVEPRRLAARAKALLARSKHRAA